MALAVDVFEPADGETGVKPNQVVRVELSNSGPVRTEVVEENGDFATGTLTDVVSKHSDHLRLDSTDTIAAIGPPATNRLFGRTVASGLPINGQDYTITFAVKFTNTAGPQIVFAMGPEVLSQGAFYGVGPNTIYIGSYTGGSSFITGLSAINDGNWHIIAWRYRSLVAEGFVDGVRVGQVGMDHSNLTGADCRIFNTPAHPTWYARTGMLIDHVVIWNAYLTDDEITEWIGFNDDRPTPASWWKFNEGSGDTAADSAGTNDMYKLAGGNSPVWGTGEFGDNAPTYDTPGDRVSPAIDVSAVSEYGDASIEWDEVVPAGTALTIEVSDDGASWQSCTNGGRLPGIYTQGQAMAGKNLYFRATLSTTDTAITPRLERVAVTFKAMLLEELEVEVAGIPCTIANGLLRSQNTTDIVGGEVAEELDNPKVYIPRLQWYQGELMDVLVEVNYAGSLLDSATFTTGEVGKTAGEDVAFAFWEALALPFLLSRSLAGIHFAVRTIKQGAVRDVAYLIADIIRRGKADVFYYVARLFINDYDGGFVVALAQVDDHDGGFVVDGVNVDDHDGGFVVQGTFIDDFEGAVVVALEHIFDSEGSFVVATDEIDDHDGGFVVRGVVKGTVIEVRVVSDASLDQMIADGFTVT